MKKALTLLILSGTIILFSFSSDTGSLFHIPAGWPQPAYDFNQRPLAMEKIALGRKLFYDPALSHDSTISCASCHQRYTAFANIAKRVSTGIKGRMGTRNAPALMNLAWNAAYMWDGAIADLDKMAQAPISNPKEMDASLSFVAARLQRSGEYRSLFYAAFKDSTVTGDRLMQSLSQFMLTLISCNSKYDAVMGGLDMFDSSEARGYRVFKKNCSTCHAEPLFTSNGYENNGLEPDAAFADSGRMKVTGKESDFMKFKVPTLRNVEVSYPYMHDGRFKDLQAVVNHYSDEIKPGPVLSAKLPGKLSLSARDKSDLIFFLKTLTDENFLKSKHLKYGEADMY